MGLSQYEGGLVASNTDVGHSIIPVGSLFAATVGKEHGRQQSRVRSAWGRSVLPSSETPSGAATSAVKRRQAAGHYFHQGTPRYRPADNGHVTHH